MELEEKDFEDMIAVVDQDRDGVISEEEFYQFVAFAQVRWLEMILMGISLFDRVVCVRLNLSILIMKVAKLMSQFWDVDLRFDGWDMKIKAYCLIVNLSQ